MRPVLIYPYSPVLVRDRLRELLAEQDPRPVVSTKATTGADESRPRPYVQVMHLGGVTRLRVRAVESIRLLVNDPDEGCAYALAELSRALLIASGVALPSSTARPTLNTDPDTGEPLATVDLDVVTAPSTRKDPDERQR